MKKLFYTIALLFASVPALAEEAAQAATGSSDGLVKFGIAIGVGIAALGCGLGQSNAARAGLEGIARNPAAQPKLFTPLILSLVFMETLVIFTVGLAFILK